MTSRNVLVKLQGDWNNSINSAVVNLLYDAGDTTPASLSSLKGARDISLRCLSKEKTASGQISIHQKI